MVLAYTIVIIISSAASYIEVNKITVVREITIDAVSKLREEVSVKDTRGPVEILYTY
jgi:hypothetical protein